MNENRVKVLKSGSCDGIFLYFANTLCHIKKNGVLGLELPNEQISSHIKARKYAELCIALIVDGTSSFYYEFITNLEYQNLLCAENNERLLEELYVIRGLANLLRTFDVSNFYYLIQHHCSQEVRESLMFEIVNIFGNDLKG